MRATLIAFALLVAACAAQQKHNLKDVNGAPFVGPAFGISFPTGWLVDEGFSYTHVIAIAPREEDDRFTETLSVVLENQSSELSASVYMEKSVPTLGRVLQDFEVVSRERRRLESGTPIALLEYTHVVSGDTIRALTGYVTVGKAGYVVTGVADDHQFATYRADFLRTIESLKFK